ncbi:disulfide bond formation protein B [Parasulfuritortus cantonensis]|uniref:Disulfide bond formation protein B n=1 Tax=Parasulfuritortus cantonensis TaxID=2528202 RepID=A0A4R1BR76_9PROT|nr:disulfide bond formation protein B [Parasulfuritortus cantonensis]TCJ20244.1 disulfide bond formation protein B [Parasulfuritortus cantonensis]
MTAPILTRLASPARLWLLMALASAALVAGSVALTQALHLHPCYLCVFQRFEFLLMALLGLAAALGRDRPAGLVAGLLFLLCAASGSAVAGYQVWLQGQPGAEFLCAGGEPNAIELLVKWLNARIPVLFKARGNCASRELVILGLSLAGWALVAFVSALLVGAHTLWRGLRRGPAG